MPRAPRTDIGGYVYHVLNRANARVRIFDDHEDYEVFELILEEVVQPRQDGDLPAFNTGKIC